MPAAATSDDWDGGRGGLKRFTQTRSFFLINLSMVLTSFLLFAFVKKGGSDNGQTFSCFEKFASLIVKD